MAKLTSRSSTASIPAKRGSLASVPFLLFGLLLAVFVAVVCFLLLASTVKIGADEDFELSKAVLLNHGYQPYTQIWDDQPPLVTALIAGVVKHFPTSILAPRLLVTGFSILLLSSFYGLVRRVSKGASFDHGERRLDWAVFYPLIRPPATFSPKGAKGLEMGGTHAQTGSLSPGQKTRPVQAGMTAALAVAILFASPGYLELSVSCMQEILVLAPTVASLACLASDGVRRRWQMTVLGAAIFGFALQMKLIGFMYFPLAFLVLGLREWFPVSCDGTETMIGGRAQKAGDLDPASRPQWVSTLRRSVVSSILFSLVSLAVFIALNYSTGSPLLLQFQQGWAAHFSQARSFEYGAPADHPFDWAILLRNWDVTLPALMGVVLLVRRIGRDPFASIPLAWLILTFAVFPTHVPWWTYYYVHNSIPLAWCAAVGWIGMAEYVFRQSKVLIAISAAASLCFFAWMCGRVYLQVQSIRQSPKLSSSLVLKEMARYKPFTEFLFADEPIYSFHSGIPMPPHLAVISLKRLWSGDMTPAKLRSEMEQTKPGLVLLNNDTQELPFQDLIDTEYRMCYQDTRHRLFVLKSISMKPYEAMRTP